MQWNLVSIEEEIERMRNEPRHETNIDAKPSKKLNFLWLIIGVILFRLVTELFG